MQRYVAPTDPFAVPKFTTSLPTDMDIALYYRQSTMTQVGNLSTVMQTIDMVDHLIQRGWRRENIILIDQDKGLSGQKKITDRPGMNELYSLILEGKVGAVACQDEDRLFRDLTGIEYNKFIQACLDNNVKVLTPSMYYDFNHPQMGTYAVKMFRQRCETAAEYITYIIKGRLNRARLLRMFEGRWAGGNVPIGYMVDDRKVLPDGTANPNWRRFVPFLPFASVVLEWFRLFAEVYGGNLNATLCHIAEHGPHDPIDYEVPEGFFIKYAVRHNKLSKGRGACYPTMSGLITLLTNAVYIGHWPVNGAIVVYNNHSAIVPEPLFFQAFNYLSSVQLDGTPNPAYTPRHVNARPKLDAKRNVEPPLCAGFLVHEYEGEFLRVGIEWNQSAKVYDYRARTHGLRPNQILFRRKVPPIDQAVVAALRERLNATFANQVWQEAIREVERDTSRERANLTAQLKATRKQKENLTASLSVLSNRALIKDAEHQYEAAEAEEQRLIKLLASSDREAKRADELRELQKRVGPALENWDAQTLEARRNCLHAFVHQIIAKASEASLRLTIHWRDNTVAELEVVTTLGGVGKRWTEYEVEDLLRMIAERHSGLEIAQHFPNRRWDVIMRKAREYIDLPVGTYSCPTAKDKTYNEWTGYANMTEQDCSGIPYGHAPIPV